MGGTPQTGGDVLRHGRERPRGCLYVPLTSDDAPRPELRPVTCLDTTPPTLWVVGGQGRRETGHSMR